MNINMGKKIVLILCLIVGFISTISAGSLNTYDNMYYCGRGEEGFWGVYDTEDSSFIILNTNNNTIIFHP